MSDFLMISTRTPKRGTIEIYPKFIINNKSKDLMIRGGDFYAIWLDSQQRWSTDEQDALDLIDSELDIFKKENEDKFDGHVKVLHLWDAESGMIDVWHKYCQKQSRDNFHSLDEKLIFSNSEPNKKDYASKHLNYPLEECDISAYDSLISTLYSDIERAKIEWAIGSIVSGDSKKIQKFMVLYGAAGTGKSTILNIIQQLFDGYYSVFDAKALGSSNNAFALEAFKTNPLVAIQHDGDLSRIEDNTRLNSLVSHEKMMVNEKFKATYSSRFKSFLFMGTNRPVKITDAKSGLIRRLIDVSPSGNKVSLKDYKSLTKKIEFELGGIAKHCLDVYLKDPHKYEDYIPTTMLGASNDFYNFVADSFFMFERENGVTLKAAWEMYKTYCDMARVSFPFSQRIFKEELKNYFKTFKERHILEDGTRVRNYYLDFRIDKFDPETSEINDSEPTIIFRKKKSILDEIAKDYKAQYANEKGTPKQKWSEVETILSELDTSELHYVKLPSNHIVIDFDLVDENGEKSFEKNLEAASRWPSTYAEISKGGSGIHLHYIYSGDITKLEKVYSDKIEIKVSVGNSALRRKLTKCNGENIATLDCGLPTKGDEKLVNFQILKSEKALRELIKRNLRKEIHPGTKPSIDFIFQILEDAYKQGYPYDVSNMRPAIFQFAQNSTNQSDYCTKLVGKMKFKSEIESEAVSNGEPRLAIFDIEIFPNVSFVNWKLKGKDKPMIRYINPKPSDIEDMIKYDIFGFNNRRYDNHMIYAMLMGYTNAQLYSLSQKLISGDRNAFFGEAYNLSYTDVYDFSSKKQSLKKFQIDLGIKHQELGLPWDEPVPEELWPKVSEYCDNDVISTEAVFDDRQADFVARQILAEVAGGTVNDTTNSLTTKIIFGSNRKPQSSFNYRFMGDESKIVERSSSDEYACFDKMGNPIFPGYKFEKGKSTYRGEEVGEGGYVYSDPDTYGNVALLDIVSMHPTSAINEQLFGKEYTHIFEQIVKARVAIKHKDFASAKKMLDGKLAKFLDDEDIAAGLAYALKIAINSVYGLTSARFENPFRDPRNIDNIVAKRGALFMINLRHAVEAKGYKVAHVKTDSIKIADADDDIIQFVMHYGRMYGYEFEHEATYDKICLVNDAVYIARYLENDGSLGKWTATGTQFHVPYVYKTIFTKEEITFDDVCETKSITGGKMYLDFNENLVDVSEEEKKLASYLKSCKKLEAQSPDHEIILAEFNDAIAKGHDYRFIGRVGRFCPVKSGFGGGHLYREKDGKYYAVTGTKDYRWKEAEIVESAGNYKDVVDFSYYDNLVLEARTAIDRRCDVEWFLSDKPYSKDDNGILPF